MEVGGAYVRIRPYVSEDDVRALEALGDLGREIAAAFDRFHARLAESAAPGDALGGVLPESAENEPREPPEGAYAAQDAPEASSRGLPPCPNCLDSGYVCEDHPDRPWAGVSDVEACCAGAGMPCPSCCSPIPEDGTRSIVEAFVPDRYRAAAA